MMTPLVRACRAARRARGSPVELAICFVALCRALDIPARLVLAMDPGSSGATAPARRGRAEPQSGAGKATSRSSKSSAELPRTQRAHELEEDLPDGIQVREVRQLAAMGFSKDAAICALLQCQQEGSSNVLDRAAELLLQSEPAPGVDEDVIDLDWNEPLSTSSKCPHCGAFQYERMAAFCGVCGKRLRPGGPLGASDSAPKADPVEVPEDSEPVVSAWPEAYDLEVGRWVAVDVIYSFIAKDPRLEWIHRGVPMLWVCAADDGLRGSSGHCVLRDVTARYSPCWWRVEQARGSRLVQQWWEQQVLDALSSWKPLADDLASSGAAAAAAEIADEADDRDVEALRTQRNSDEMPTTKAGLKGHKRYVLASDLRQQEALRPGVKAKHYVNGMPVYSRDDVAKALVVSHWQKRGRRVKPGEEPVKRIKPWQNRPEMELFAEWQTEVEDGLVLQSTELEVKEVKGRLRFGRGLKSGRGRGRGRSAGSGSAGPAKRRRRFGKQRAESMEIGLPALPAPPKARAARRMSKPNLAFRKATFEDGMGKLRAWFETSGFLPFAQSDDKEERLLSQWVLRVRVAYSRRRLSQEQIDALESLEEWDWGDYEGGAADAGPEDAEEADDTGGPRGQKRPGSAEGAEQGKQQNASNANGDVQEAEMEHWSRLTLQRLAQDLNRQPSAADKRSRLRAWQRIYHPDKNPGRAHEVLPIFRWVQSCWDRDFKTAETSGSAGAASASTAASSASTAASSGGGAAAPPPAAPPSGAGPSRRLTKKTRMSAA